MDRARNSQRLFISLHFLWSERFDFVFMLCFNNQLDRRSVAPFALSFLQDESFSWISDHCLKIHDSTTSITRKIRRNRSYGQYVNEFRLISLGFFVLLTVSTFSAVISLGINSGDVKKLQDAGIYTCNGLMMHTKKVIRFESSRSEDQFHELPIDSYLLFTELDWNKRIIRGKGGEDLWSCRKARGKSSDVSRSVNSSLHFVWFSSIWNLCVVWSFFSQNFGYVTGSDVLLKVGSEILTCAW